MAKRITEEQIIQINEIYLECRVKSKTAQIVGVSPSTVSKYLIPNYVSQKNQKPVESFNKEIGCAEDFLKNIITYSENNKCSKVTAFCQLCNLSSDEKEELKEIQKNIMI